MWGLVCWVGALLREAASAFSSGPRTAGRAFLRSTLMFLRADRVCCGGYAASASRFGGAALLAGLSTCMMWRGRRGRAGPGPGLVLARFFCVELVFGWLAACCGYCSPLRYGMWAEGCPLEERVYSRRRPVASTGARRRRACVWSGVAPPLSLWGLVSGSLLEREREVAVIFPRSVARSTACV